MKAGVYADWVNYEFWVGIDCGDEHLIEEFDCPNSYIALAKKMSFSGQLYIDWKSGIIKHEHSPMVELRIDGETVSANELKDWYDELLEDAT